MTLPPGLLRRQADFLRLLTIQPSLTRADYQSLSGVSYNTARADLAELLTSGLIIRVGASTRTRYVANPLQNGTEAANRSTLAPQSLLNR